MATTLALLASSAMVAQAAIGLSAVRAEAFFNEEIDGFPPEHGDVFALALAAGDFNGDGAQDLATGIPGDNGPADLPLDNAGAVIVRWGVPGKGLATTPSPTILSLYTAGGPAQAHAHAVYGRALAAGDFNGDGQDDLAVGIPGFGTSVGEDYDVGAVAIHYGEPGGIQLAAEHLLFSGVAGNIPDPPGGMDSLGWALAAGDFDGDGFYDLAVGAPQLYLGYNVGGAVVVLHGGTGGLLPVVGYLIYQNDPQVPDDGEEPDDFGYALAVGDFDGTGHADLAIGIPNRDQAGIADAGAESILYGALFADGFASGNDDFWSESNP